MLNTQRNDTHNIGNKILYKKNTINNYLFMKSVPPGPSFGYTFDIA